MRNVQWICQWILGNLPWDWSWILVTRSLKLTGMQGRWISPWARRNVCRCSPRMCGYVPWKIGNDAKEEPTWHLDNRFLRNSVGDMNYGCVRLVQCKTWCNAMKLLCHARQCHARCQAILFRKWHLDIQMQYKFSYSGCTVLGICKCMCKYTNVGQALVYGGQSDMHTCINHADSRPFVFPYYFHTMRASTLTCFHIQMTFMIYDSGSPSRPNFAHW